MSDEKALNTAKRLHVAEKAWHQLASHFTLLLSERDTESLTQIQRCVDEWRERAEAYAIVLLQRDDKMTAMIKVVVKKIDELKALFDEHFM